MNGANTPFPLSDRQLSLRFDCDFSAIPPGQTAVVETPLRLVAEEHFSYVRALWWVWLADGRSVVSVPPGAGREVAALVTGITDPCLVYDPALAAALRRVIDRVLREAGLPGTHGVFADRCFAGNADLLRRAAAGDCRRLTEVTLPHAEGLWWPPQCIEEGVAYGVMADEMVVAIAYAHRTATMPDRVADIAVCTAEPYRRRGYARTAVTALVAHCTRTGGEVRYTCDIDNSASIATARSVGFVAYGASLLMLTKPERI